MQNKNERDTYSLIGCTFFFLAAMAAIICGIFLHAAPAASNIKPATVEETDPTPDELKALCSLDSVVCPGEDPGTEYLATAYSAREEETDDTPCTAADGSDICIRHANKETICATNDLPFKTKVRLEAKGISIECIISDRMNRRYTGQHRIDIFFGDDTDAASAFGARKVLLTKQ